VTLIGRSGLGTEGEEEALREISLTASSPYPQDLKRGEPAWAPALGRTPCLVKAVVAAGLGYLPRDIHDTILPAPPSLMLFTKAKFTFPPFTRRRRREREEDEERRQGGDEAYKIRVGNFIFLKQEITGGLLSSMASHSASSPPPPLKFRTNWIKLSTYGGRALLAKRCGKCA